MIATDEHTTIREKTFIQLYKAAFPAVASFVRQNGGSFEEARDIFQDALVIFYEKNQTNLHGLGNKAYLLGIARYLWYKYYDQSARRKTFDDREADYTETPPDSHPSSEKLLKFLEHTGERCLEILRAFYYDKLSMARMSLKFGFAGERSATVQKFKCLEKVRDRVKEQKMSYEDFLE